MKVKREDGKVLMQGKKVREKQVMYRREMNLVHGVH